MKVVASHGEQPEDWCQQCVGDRGFTRTLRTNMTAGEKTKSRRPPVGGQEERWRGGRRLGENWITYSITTSIHNFC